uniref:Reverse transcriptase domain-containing protein n=1 Tax=Cannabis sativa TaxID=3483 RepID=A0A803QCJ3_CANSA
MIAVVLSNPREVVIIAPIGYGVVVGLLKGLTEHLCKSFFYKLRLSRYFNFLYLKFWFLWRSLLILLLVFHFSPVFLISRCFPYTIMDSLALNISEILNLTYKEVVVHDLEDDTRGVNLNNKPICLFFRILSPRTIKPEWFEHAMRNAWVTRAPLTFSNYGSGMFMVEFQCEGDMRRVLERQPWHFDHCLVTCANPAGLDTLLPNQLRYSPFWIQVHSIPFGQKSLKLAKLIGDEVGDFLEVDKLTLLKVSGLFLWIRVLIDVSKSITRGILVDFKSIHREKWLNFKYENFPNICYHCGMFDHTLTKCITYLKKCDDHSFPSSLPYKIPLKASAKSTFKRNPFDLSNSFPFDELTSHQENVDQSLAAAVSQFLTTEEIEGLLPRISEKAKGKVVAGAKRAAFLPLTTVVGDSLRNILKRARAGPTIAEVSSAFNNSLEQAGDFNDYLSISDRSNNINPPNYAMVHFQRFLCKFSLFPLNPIGSKFTWKHGFYGSDHRVLRIVLDDDSMALPRHKRFMFENFWLTEPSFFDTVKTSWLQSHSTPAPKTLNSFLIKQQACVNDIKNWNAGANVKLVTTLQSQLDSLLYKNEILWKQRSKIHWLQAGDKNTRYFHNKATVRRKSNYIRKLKCSNGRIVTSFGEICNEVRSYFGDLFQSQNFDVDASNHLLSTLDKSLDTQLIHFLDSPFDANEVKQALFQLSSDKAPGLDGLNPAFYQKNWHVLGHDLTTVFLETLNNSTNLSSINDTLIVLIPKKSNASTLKDFRPISLCSTLYKIVAKILSNRLKLVLGSLISPSQSAFLSERIMFDNIYIAQEVVHAINHRKQGKLGWVGLKLDMEKAFDRVEWDFLLAILRKFNFPAKFINLIHQCISSVTIRFNINGQISDPILPSRGIRQGDPLSPYLFLLCSEGLTPALRLQEQRGSFRGISIARTAPAIFHLLFADDTLLFTIASPSSCDALKEALTIYNLATGQRVNYAKSSILFSPNTPPSITTYFFKTLGLEPRPFISKYLGIPKCFGCSKKSSFDFLLQRVGSQLSIWNEKLFSKAGKEVLLKVVFKLFLLIPCLASNYPPQSVIKLRDLWLSFGGVRWGKAMLANQAWRVFSNPTSLLATVLKAKYFRHNGFLEAKLGHSPSYTWSSLLWGRDLLKNGLRWKVVSFFIDDQGFWNRDKLTHYFDDFSVSSILKVPIGGLQRDDILVWNHEASGIFSVESAYHLANSASLPPSSSNPSFFTSWWKTLWNLSLPPKIKSFSWRVYHHILPVAINLFLRKAISQPCCSIYYQEAMCNVNRYKAVHNQQATGIEKTVPQNCYQLNMDAALCAEHMKLGFGAVIKDWQGNLVVGLSIPAAGNLQPTMAKALALRAGLIWCHHIKILLAVVDADSKMLVNRVLGRKSDLLALSDVVEDIRSSLSLFPNVILRHTSKQFNCNAHSLARRALGQDEELCWNVLVLVL